MTLTSKLDAILAQCRAVLTNSQRVDYCNRLVRMLYDNYHSAIQATPTQRCEAFLRTLNLWKPTT